MAVRDGKNRKQERLRKKLFRDALKRGGVKINPTNRAEKQKNEKLKKQKKR